MSRSDWINDVRSLQVEIERLRSQLCAEVKKKELLLVALEAMHEKFSRWRAENERLRAEKRICADALDNSHSEIERLRAEGLRFLAWIDELYGGLPREEAPGPPITLMRQMRAAFGAR